jgi:hypothetical protein
MKFSLGPSNNGPLTFWVLVIVVVIIVLLAVLATALSLGW